MSLKSFSVCSFKENKVGDFNRDDEKRVWAAGKLSTTLSTNKMNDAQNPLVPTGFFGDGQTSNPSISVEKQNHSNFVVLFFFGLSK